MNHSKPSIPISYHLVARTRHGQVPFLNPEIANDTWRLLRKSFPDAHAAVLMPNHLHLLTPLSTSKDHHFKLNTILHHVAMKHRLSRQYWEETPSPQSIPDLHHLLRQVRYVHLNPCRKKLVSCPLEWKYSTHRHALKFCLKPWGGPQKILNLMNWSHQRFHSYVSSDPSCDPNGTPVPTPPQQQKISQFSAHDIQQTVQSLSPLSNPVRRKLLLWLMKDQGFEDLKMQKLMMGVTARRIQQLHHRPGPHPNTLQLLRTILNDPRLRGGGKISF